MFKVLKKDGRQEDFDRNKITSGVLKSGATQEQAEQIVQIIEAWLPVVAVNGAVSVLDIRKKVIDELKAINPTAGANFESYQKPVMGPSVVEEPLLSPPDQKNLSPSGELPKEPLPSSEEEENPPSSAPPSAPPIA